LETTLTASHEREGFEGNIFSRTCAVYPLSIDLRGVGGSNVWGKTLAPWSDRVSPARYVVCKSLKVGTDDVREYLFSVNIKLNQLRNTDSDVNLVVPLMVIKGDHEFTDYMIRSNER
jgi:hypothetical protein